jgi:hypothetical protein
LGTYNDVAENDGKQDVFHSCRGFIAKDNRVLIFRTGMENIY